MAVIEGAVAEILAFERLGSQLPVEEDEDGLRTKRALSCLQNKKVCLRDTDLKIRIC